jgi:hypothetical protein
MGLDWNWSLGSGSGGGGNVVQSDTSGAAILAALLGGGSNNNASTQSVDGTADNNVTDGGGSTTYANTGLAPNFSGNAPIFKGGGGGGGGGGGASANGQKAVFDARTKTWSLYDPTSKKWTDGIGQNDIYSQLTGTLKDESPEWWWGDTARSAVNQEEYQNLRYANQYQSTQQGNRQQTRYSTYGL